MLDQHIKIYTLEFRDVHYKYVFLNLIELKILDNYKIANYLNLDNEMILSIIVDFFDKTKELY